MNYKLVCFDVDGTLMEDKDGKIYWTLLHSAADGEKGLAFQQECREEFYAGRLTYEKWVDISIESFRDKGLGKKEFEEVARRQKLITGVIETIHELKQRGYKLAIISGSLNILFDTLFPEHPFDDVFISEISFDEKGNVQSWKSTPFDFHLKAEALKKICEKEHISLAEAVFVGDGENDIDVLQQAGLGIAFCPKSDNVGKAANVVIEKKDLREILKYL